MFSELTDATGQIDPKFLISYWLPALVATMGSLVVSALLVGPDLFDFWANNLDSVEQILIGVVLLGVTTVLSLFFKAVKRPVQGLFAGGFLPRPVAAWGTRRQLRAKAHVEHLVSAGDEQDLELWMQRARHTLERGFPQASGHVKPTRYGNVLASLEEHTRFVHGMDVWLWWPRLKPLLPDVMAESTESQDASTTGLLNLSLVWAAIGLGGAAVLGFVGQFWTTALWVLVIGLLLSWCCYRAAVQQGTEAGRYLHAAFDLYRHEILKQMELDVPSDHAAETALWQALTRQLMDRSPKVSDAHLTPDAPINIAKNGHTRHRPPAARSMSTA